MKPFKHYKMQDVHVYRGICGAGYDFPSSVQLTRNKDEVTCPNCKAKLVESGTPPVANKSTTTNVSLNFDAVLLDNSPVAAHVANCSKCNASPAIRDLCVSFYTLLFAPNDNTELKTFHERMIRKVQTVISDITKSCENAQ